MNLLIDVQPQLTDKHSSDLYALIKAGIVKKPSIIFSWHREKEDKTVTNWVHQCKNVKIDSWHWRQCSLFLVNDAKMPVGCPLWCVNANTFTLNSLPKNKVAHEWLAYQENIFIHQKHHDREVHTGDRKLSVHDFRKNKLSTSFMAAVGTFTSVLKTTKQLHNPQNVPLCYSWKLI